MNFKTSHQRSVTGNNIHVEIECGKDEVVDHVKVELDDFPLADDDLQPPSEEYVNDFLNAGDAGPLMDHTLIVTVATDDEKEHSSTTKWTDAN